MECKLKVSKTFRPLWDKFLIMIGKTWSQPISTIKNGWVSIRYSYFKTILIDCRKRQSLIIARQCVCLHKQNCLLIDPYMRGRASLFPWFLELVGATIYQSSVSKDYPTYNVLIRLWFWFQGRGMWSLLHNTWYMDKIRTPTIEVPKLRFYVPATAPFLPVKYAKFSPVLHQTDVHRT